MHSPSPAQIARTIAGSIVKRGGLFDGLTLRSGRLIQEAVRLLLIRIQNEISTLFPDLDREQGEVKIFFSRLLLFVDHLLQTSAAVVALEAPVCTSDHEGQVGSDYALTVTVRMLDCACEILDRNKTLEEMHDEVETEDAGPTVPPGSAVRLLEFARASIRETFGLTQPTPSIPSSLLAIARKILVVIWQREMAKRQAKEAEIWYVEFFALQLFTLLRADLGGYSVGVENDCRK